MPRGPREAAPQVAQVEEEPWWTVGRQMSYADCIAHPGSAVERRLPPHIMASSALPSKCGRIPKLDSPKGLIVAGGSWCFDISQKADHPV